MSTRFKDLGHKVEITAVSGDHDMDLVARRDNAKVVQCKRYRDSTVGQPMMRNAIAQQLIVHLQRTYRPRSVVTR